MTARPRRNPAGGPEVVTLGCRLNAFESEVMRELGDAAGLADTVIVNTCAVTAEAERQARQTIRRIRRERPTAEIVVTGCAAQLNAHAFAAMAEVDRVLGNAEKLDIGFLAPAPDRAGAKLAVSDIMAVRETAPHLIAGFDGRTRAFVQVQQGCDHRCTFCIIPFARGANRSVDRPVIIEQVRTLVDGGIREVVLTGVDICSYGADLPGRPTLGRLAAAILAAVPELPRLRLSTVDPAALDDDVFRLLAESPRLMPHLHLSLQAMDDIVLKRMKRRHTVADAERLVARARAARPDVVFGADLIAGFPTESDAMFAATLAAIDRLGLTHLHVFPYSPRPGTPAARMPQVPERTRKARAARLRDVGGRALARFLGTRVGISERVLVEADNRGLSEHYVPVRLDFDVRPGTVAAVRATGVVGACLLAGRTP